MLKIRFLDGTTTQAEFISIKNGIIQLTGANVENLTGFKAYNQSALLLGDYSTYTTKYNRYTELENSIQLSTGAVEPEPIAPTYTINFVASQGGSLDGTTSVSVADGTEMSSVEVPEVVVDENYIFKQWSPAIEDIEIHSSRTYTAVFEYVPTLEEVQEAKVTEMNAMQQSVIEAGVDVTLTDGTVEHFELTSHDQASLTGLQTQVIEGVEYLPWHTSDNTEHCKYYTNENMAIITNTAMQCITFHVTYFRDLRITIRAMQDKDAINDVTYGMIIPLEYQSQPLQDMYAAINE